jgi:tetratricopeptide (TPR) repeat protein
LPSVGFLLFVLGCCLELPDRGRKLALGVAYCAVLALGVRSFVRSSDWVDPETFYRRTLGSGGYSVRVALNLGQIYAAKKDYAKAEELCRKVLQLTPDYPIARNNLAVYLNRQGKTEEARAVLDAATKHASAAPSESPRSWVSALNLARLRYDKEQPAATLEILAKARSQYPGVWDLISFEAEVLRAAGQPEVALKIVQEFIAKHWWHYPATLAAGRLYAELNDVSSAEAALWHASWLDVREIEALNLLCQIRQRQNRIDEAFEIQQRAVARQPDEPRQYLMLSQILTKMGRTVEAEATLAQVSRLQVIGQSEPLVN